MLKETEERQDMFVAFCEKQSNDYVAKKCKIHWQTVRKYRERDKWDERYAKIAETVKEQIDKEVSATKKRQLERVRLVQNKGMKFFIENDLTSGESSVAAKLVIDGIKLEREILGERKNINIYNKTESLSDDEVELLKKEIKEDIKALGL